jgi:hypothetical protein
MTTTRIKRRNRISGQWSPRLIEMLGEPGIPCAVALGTPRNLAD